ncbi:KSR2 Kinase, partial [Podilymbus podiceps]|nr:KSR2 Kinase [Podilymbus podiceps]
QSKLVKYFSRQLSCKRKVALQERNAKLEGFPQLLHWFRIVDIRKEVMEEIAPGQLSLEELLDMTDDQVCATVKKFGANSEECARLNASLSCLRSVHKSGGSLSKQDWTIQWPTTEPGKENSPGCQPEPGQWGRTHLSQSPKVQPKCGQHHCHASSPHGPMYTHVDRLTVEGHPGLCPPVESGHRSLPPSPRQRHVAHTPPRTPNIVTTMTPPGTPPVRRRNKLKPPGTPPPSSRKLIHLIPGFTALHRSKSHEFQLGHRVDEAHTPKGDCREAEKPRHLLGRYAACCSCPLPLAGLVLLQILGYLPLLFSSPLLLPEDGAEGCSRVHHPAVPGAGTPAAGQGQDQGEASEGSAWPLQPSRVLAPGLQLLLGSPRVLWALWPYPAPTLPSHGGASCQLSLLEQDSKFGGARSACAHPDKDSLTGKAKATYRQSKPRNSFPPSHGQAGVQPSPGKQGSIARNGELGRQTPSLRTSPPSSSFPRLYMPSVTPCGVEHPLGPLGSAVPAVSPPGSLCPPASSLVGGNEEGTEEAQESEDDFEEMNLSLLSARNFPRKASQTSIFLQEWDIPFEQLEIGELIGKGRFGQVFHGRWHGEVAIRLIDIERDNEDQLKAFKRECKKPSYWKGGGKRIYVRHYVAPFNSGCRNPRVLSSLFSCSFSLCKGRTLYSVVRDAKIVLDVNKTRQIAQEIVKGMGYLHAKGILHKDLKSKNVFYDNGKVVITDFGLFSISGVLQAGRRENKLRIQNGWLCHLAPEIIRQLSPDTEEDKLPFSKHSDVFALGTIWYELHAREWPFKTQPAEAIIWQVGRGMKPNLSQIGMGKEISDILLFCWAYEQEERPTFTKLMDMLEKLPKRNRRLSHPGHFWKSAE